MTTQSHATRCIALVQLETALRLYFEREDYFSVITLAANAEEIFGKIVTAKGIDNSLETKKKNVDAMHRYLYGSAFPESEIAGRANFAKNAMKHGIGLDKILGTIHTYPTLPEANKYVAGVWKRSQVTHGQMALAKAFNDWTRGEAGLGGVVAKLFALRDKRPYYTAPTGAVHGDD